MSSIKAEVTKISEVRPHPNADALELATVGGWQMCVKKGVYKNGDPIVYFEQGTTLPREVADSLGVTQYLKERDDIDGNKVLIIHRVRLRGEPSFGLVITPEPGMEVGQDVADYYGAQKYYPPVRTQAGDADYADPLFPSYTDIENLRSYPDVIADGEEVVVTEKIHGTNCRVGFVKDGVEYVLMAGSKGLRRKRPATEDDMRLNTYWYPHTLPDVSALLVELQNRGLKQAVLYGEVFGHGIQSFTYGLRGIAFRAFDLLVDGRFMNYDDFAALCRRFEVETVPVIYRGAFLLSAIRQLSEGDSLVGGNQGREGVVVKTTYESNDLKIGRVILKYLSDAYLFGKAGEQDTTDI